MNEPRKKSEREVMQQTIKFFDNLLRASIDGILITDATHHIIVANEAFCNLIGQQHRDVIETNLFCWLERLDPHGISRWTELVNEIHRKGSCRNVEFVTKPDSRALKYLSVNASLLEKVATEETGVIMSIWRDVTEQKQAMLLADQMRITTFLKDVGIALTRGNTLQEILRHCADAVVSNLDAAFARIWALNKEKDVLELQASAGIYTHIDGPHSQIPVGKFKIGLIAREQRPILTNSVIDDVHISNKEWAKREGMIAFAGYPLIIEGRLVGVIAMFARKILSEFTIRALAAVADVIALGIVHKQDEEELRKSEKRFRTIFENANDGILMIDIETQKFHTGNKRICQMLGYTPEEIKKLSLMDIHSKGDLPYIQEQFEKYVNREIIQAEDMPLKRKDGSVFYADVNTSLIAFAGKTYLMGIMRDVTERRQTEEKIRHLAFHDALTNLPNRILFTDRLNLALAHAHRTQEMLAVLFMDLDRFKIINDTLGHTVGDQLLRGVAERLKNCVREDDTIARLGGDEFSLLLPGITREEDVNTIADKLIEILKKPWTINGHELYVTASLGIVLYPNDGKDAETLLKNADAAMYHAKEQGKNNYQFYTSTMHAESLRKMIMERDIRRALNRNEFVVHYQPFMNITTGQITGMEALVRWQHPQRGLILPDEFLPLAEDIRLIVSIDEWVLRTVCTQNKTWRDARFQPGCIAVNLSAHTFQQRNITNIVTTILKEVGLDPQFLGLEITEGIAMQDIETTIHKLKEMSDLNIQIAIDDFGTGFSSLSYLKKFPVNKLKISPHFVSGIVDNQKDKVIVSSIVALAQGLHFRVIAEGVENMEQLALLKQLECDELQGNLFCQPLSAEVIEKMLWYDKICVDSWHRKLSMLFSGKKSEWNRRVSVSRE
ncbi:MAG: EAL domain-containing protein [Candidatus Brocadia sp.]|nr:EAL domain-containing protein [Candidatus Brocadia sp.]MDG6025286.1 EAL domain-containing protein [Candidatus Brocadia sp.]